MTQKVLYIGQLGDSSGYGNAARNYIKCFDEYLSLYSDSIDFKIVPMNYETKNHCTEQEQRIIEKYLLNESGIMSFIDSNTKVIIHLVPEVLQNPYWTGIINVVGKKNMFSSMAWEPDALPEHWVSLYKQKVDNFIVYCDFTRQCFLNHGFAEDKVHLIPHPIFDIESTDPNSLNKEKFNIFSMSQWNDRKGWDILIPAVCHEFFHHDDVQLSIKTFRHEAVGAPPRQEKEAVINAINALKQKVTHHGKLSSVKIRLVCGLVDKSLISDMFQDSSVYCLPTRCDSFGLTIGEAVISNRVAIVPSLGGHRDYFSDDNPFLVDSQMKPCFVEGDLFSTLDMNLVETDYNDLRRKLRKAYEMWIENPSLLASQASKNYDYAVSEVINHKKIFFKFLKAMGVES